MATVDGGGGGHGGKKSVDQEIPLIPFIDLLFCCVMFLLATAVWNKMARIDANQRTPGRANPDEIVEPTEPVTKLYLKIRPDQYIISTTAGDNETIDVAGGEYNTNELDSKLRARHERETRPEANRNEIIVAPINGVAYADIIEAMDIAVGTGYQDISLADGSAL